MIQIVISIDDEIKARALGEQVPRQIEAEIVPSDNLAQVVHEKMASAADLLAVAVGEGILSAKALNEMAQQLAEQRPRAFLLGLGMTEAASVAALTENLNIPVRAGYWAARLRFYEICRSHIDVPVHLGGWVFYPRARKFCRAEEELRLTEKEAALFAYLAAAPAFVSRAELLEAVWGYESGIDTHTLETHIYRLRRLLPNGEQLIIAQAGGSYGLNKEWQG